jgi:hypothetical protein
MAEVDDAREQAREAAIQRVMRDLRMTRESAERFVDYSEGRMLDTDEAEDEGGRDVGQ